MKVRISFLINIENDLRRAINYYYGRPGLASRNEIKDWYEITARTDESSNDLWFEWCTYIAEIVLLNTEHQSLIVIDPYDRKVINKRLRENRQTITKQGGTKNECI